MLFPVHHNEYPEILWSSQTPYAQEKIRCCVHLYLTNQKQFYMENYPDVVIENGKIDDLVVMMEEQV